jgi:hypothetical protein
MNNTENWAPAGVLTSRRGLGRNSVKFSGPLPVNLIAGPAAENVHTVMPADRRGAASQ